MTTEKIALVTGGNKGIGLEITRQLRKAGFRVFLTARDLLAAAICDLLAAALRYRQQGEAARQKL